MLVVLERLGLQSFAAGVLGAPAHAVVLAQSGVPKSETVAASALSQERRRKNLSGKNNPLVLLNGIRHMDPYGSATNLATHPP